MYSNSATRWLPKYHPSLVTSLHFTSLESFDSSTMNHDVIHSQAAFKLFHCVNSYTFRHYFNTISHRRPTALLVGKFSLLLSLNLSTRLLREPGLGANNHMRVIWLTFKPQVRRNKHAHIIRHSTTPLVFRRKDPFMHNSVLIQSNHVVKDISKIISTTISYL